MLAWEFSNSKLYIYIFWENYNNSPTWIKAIWGWFPLLTMIPVRSQWGRYNLPRYIYWLVVYLPRWKIWVSWGWMELPNWMESHKIPWFQTTNQILYIYIRIYSLGLHKRLWPILFISTSWDIPKTMITPHVYWWNHAPEGAYQMGPSMFDPPVGLLEDIRGTRGDVSPFLMAGR